MPDCTLGRSADFDAGFPFESSVDGSKLERESKPGAAVVDSGVPEFFAVFGASVGGTVAVESVEDSGVTGFAVVATGVDLATEFDLGAAGVVGFELVAFAVVGSEPVAGFLDLVVGGLSVVMTEIR